MTVTTEWVTLPPFAQQSPILALQATSLGLLAGGYGGLAIRANDGWHSLPSANGLPGTVLALAEAGTALLAAGVGGIARSVDGGKTWLLASGTESWSILTMATAPFATGDSTILAGTTSDGVLRSADGGTTWSRSNFGLTASEVSIVLWTSEQSALANTPEGVFRSTNGGRSWRPLLTQPFVCLSHCLNVLGITADGDVWQSDDGSDRWHATGTLPSSSEPQALAALPDGSWFAGTANHGIFHSSDGQQWTQRGDENVLTFARESGNLYAGTTAGVLAYNAQGRSWQSLGSPTLADHARIFQRNGTVYASGELSAPQRWTESEGWSELSSCPSPLRAFSCGWGAEIVATTPAGFFVSLDRGDTWEHRSQSPCSDLFTSRADGTGWLAARDGSALAITRDHGASWSPLDPPFGVLPLIALQSPADVDDSPLIAVTYDVAAQSATLWMSYTDGESWKRTSGALTNWPVAATAASPLTVSVGDAIIVSGPDGSWVRIEPKYGAVRKLAASPAGLVILTEESLWLRRRESADWMALPDRDSHQIIDINLEGDSLVALFEGGQVRILNLALV